MSFDTDYSEADAMNLWMSLPKLEWRHKSVSSKYHEDKEFEHVYRLVKVTSAKDYYNLQRYTQSSCKKASYPWFIDMKKSAVVLFFGVVEPADEQGKNFTRWFENEPMAFLSEELSNPLNYIKEHTHGSVTDINEPLVVAFLRKSGFPK